MLASPLNAEVNVFFQIVWYTTTLFIFSIPMIVFVLTIIIISALFREGHLNFDWQSLPFVIRFMTGYFRYAAGDAATSLTTS